MFSVLSAISKTLKYLSAMNQNLSLYKYLTFETLVPFKSFSANQEKYGKTVLLVSNHILRNNVLQSTV